MTRLEKITDLARHFGAERFTAGKYWSDVVGRPGLGPRIRETQEEFENLVREGVLVEAPGPRGGKGFRLTDHSIAEGLRAAERRDRNARRRMKEASDRLERNRQREINAAIKFLQANGYTVTPNM